MFIFHLDSSIVGKRSHNRRIFIYLIDLSNEALHGIEAMINIGLERAE
jgi:hypothetical protein